MKIFELLDELREEISNSPKSVFSNKKAVDSDILVEILDDLKTVIPEELAMAQKVMQDKEKILFEAKEQAENIVKSAEAELAERIAEDVVTQAAEEKAKETMKKAEGNAKEIIVGAKEYADDIMRELEIYFADYLKLLRKNRLQLSGKRKRQ